MTCVDSDMKQNGSAAVEGANAWSSIRCSFCYADDTVLFSTQPLALNELLFHIEECSGHYGLKINRSKCHSIHMYHESNIQFQDGTPVNKTQGIQDTTRTWLRLDILWKDPDSNPKWKLLIYDAVIRSKQCSASPIFRTLLDTFPAECPSYMVKTQTVCIRFLFSDFWTLFGVPVRKQNAAALIFILSVSAWVGVHAQKQLFGVGLGRC